MTTVFRAVGAACALAVSAAAAGHHSTAEFDYSKTVLLEGTIKEVQWTNPHSYVQVMVPQKDGSVAQWGIEIGAPAINVAMGWRKNSVKQGDKVKLDVAPARSGATYGTLRHLTFPDGRTLDGVAARVKAGPSGSIAG
ncbi:DUF6152 family protein [Croceibacterium aestuarii]|uniref:DUF6152 family protein n=1 Tax=Croceibacterium aestuarii TaxID=3064139 RepID=UPI00272E6B8C|nr:DUF6152 family protein [Croceibacterium sp. D39]